jgi:hypothetical protein
MRCKCVACLRGLIQIAIGIGIDGSSFDPSADVQSLVSEGALTLLPLSIPTPMIRSSSFPPPLSLTDYPLHPPCLRENRLLIRVDSRSFAVCPLAVRQVRSRRRRETDRRRTDESGLKKSLEPTKDICCGLSGHKGTLYSYLSIPVSTWGETGVLAGGILPSR